MHKEWNQVCNTLYKLAFAMIKYCFYANKYKLSQKALSTLSIYKIVILNKSYLSQ